MTQNNSWRGVAKLRFNKSRSPSTEPFNEKKNNEIKRWKAFRKIFRGSKYRQSWLNFTIPLFLFIIFALSYSYNPEIVLSGGRRLSSCGEVIEEAEGDASFPKDIFTQEQRQQGFLALHCICILYMFIGLSIICDDHFEPILGVICEKLDLSTDVAGATFMAAGGSAPELFTSIFGVFVATNDIGFGTIVGSAVFNVLFVIAICAWIAPGLKLSWYPLSRDCSFYCCSIIVLVMCVIDQQIFWYEALALLSCYGLYVFLMKNNDNVFNYVTNELLKPEPWSCSRRICRKIAEYTIFKIIIYVVILANLTFLILENSGNGDSGTWDLLNYICSGIYIGEFLLKLYGFGVFRYWSDAWNALDGVLVLLIGVEFGVSASGGRLSAMRSFRLARFMSFLRSLRVMRLLEPNHVLHDDKTTQTKERDFLEAYEWTELQRKSSVSQGELEIIQSSTGVEIFRKVEQKRPHSIKSMSSIVPLETMDLEEDEYTYADSLATKMNAPRASFENKVRISTKGDALEKMDEESSDSGDGPDPLFEMPDTAGGKVWWFVTFPLRLCFQTIPNCTEEEKHGRWPLSFIICIFWIAVLTYVMVWMATIFGDTVGIPDPVMGLTLLAGGTSIPDLLSSAAVARKGYGDMAVSSSIGSNIFDILVGLPLPWLVYGIIYQGKTVPIKSDGMVVMVISLFIMVAFVCLSIHYCDWQLNAKLAYIFVGLYCLFVFESLLLEYGIILASC